MEEDKIQDAEIISESPVGQPVETSQPELVSPQPAPVELKPESADAKPEAVSPSAAPEAPEVIIRKERGFTYYVGFALLTVLSVVFFFIPGISLVYLVSVVAAISAPVAWIFAALLSVIIWFIFKLKIKGFKKSFLWYIGLCALLSVVLASIAALTEYKVLSGIFNLLVGGAA